MAFPADHYPISGVQHTRTVTALTIAQICLELFCPEPGTEIEKHMLAIQSSIKKCSSLTKKKRLSAGAMRDMDNCQITLAPYVEKLQCSNGVEKFLCWASLVWCALTFVEDAINTCPQYTGAAETPKWDKLKNLMEELTDSLRRVSSKSIDERGTYIYERCAWALEGVNFKDEREVEFG